MGTPVLTNERNLYDLMARILLCASKHQACADDPEFQMLSMEACAIPVPAVEPTPERNLLREVLVANHANVDTATHLPEDLTDRIRALVDQGGQRGS